MCLNEQIMMFNKRFKRIFVLESLKKIFSNLDYNPDKGLDYNILANTKMMNIGDRYSSNDYFEADKNKKEDVKINLD